MAQQAQAFELKNLSTTFRPALEEGTGRADRAQQQTLPLYDSILGGRYVLAQSPGEIEPPSSRNSEQSVDAVGIERISGNEPEVKRRNVIEIPRLELPPQSFKPLQQWRGTVTTIAESEFDAELRDLTDRTRARETATFRFGELSDGDQDLVQIGAVFYWSIGYELTPTRQRKLVATIIFRRLPRWTKRQLDAVRAMANEIEEILGISNPARRTA